MFFKNVFLLLVLIFSFPGFSIRPLGDCVVGFEDKYGEFYNRSEHNLDVGEMFRWNFQEGKIDGENSFFFGSSVQTGRITKKINDDTVLAQIINAKGELQETELKVNMESRRISITEGKEIYYDVGQGSPQLEAVFTAVKSNKRRLNFIPKEHQEQSQALKAKGFKESDYRGIDEIYAMIALKEQFRKQEVNPYKTHIDYFANKVEGHLNYVKETIPPSKQRALERLEEHARSIIQQKGVTYRWWIKFNYALSGLFGRTQEDIAEGSSIGNHKRSIDELVALFPSVVLVPLTGGETSVMTINAGSFHGIYVLGLIRENTKLDGDLTSPRDFFEHDLGHAIAMSEYFNTRYDSVNYREFYGRLMERIQALPFEKRKYAELAYFILTHEVEAFISSREYYARNYLENIEYNMADSFYNRSGLSFELKTEEIELMVDIIMEAVIQIQGFPPPKKRPWNKSPS